MKTIFSNSDAATERAMNAAAERKLQRNAAERAEQRPELRVIRGEAERPQVPSWSQSAHIQISEEGRALIARMAKHAEDHLVEGTTDEAIAKFVAEGIEEGFLE